MLRDRHRRLCVTCAKTPIGNLTKPPLGRGFSVESDDVQRAICRCDTDGVWLCQPCGKTIRTEDCDYKRYIDLPSPPTYYAHIRFILTRHLSSASGDGETNTPMSSVVSAQASAKAIVALFADAGVTAVLPGSGNRRSTVMPKMLKKPTAPTCTLRLPLPPLSRMIPTSPWLCGAPILPAPPVVTEV